MTMKISKKGLELIKKYEGCRLEAYKCAAGVWTIGYGHTSGVTKGQTITAAQAEEYLRKDCEKAEKNVNSYYDKYKWNQNQFDALVSFAFNIGSINQLTANGTRSISVISNKILEYKKAGGKVLAGLVRRRKEERALFNTPCENEPAKMEFEENPYKEPTQTVTSKAQAKAKKIKKYISSGEGVGWVQWHLQRLGFDLGKWGVDCSCGNGTVKAIIEFQKKAGIDPDGLAGKTTRKELVKY